MALRTRNQGLQLPMRVWDAPTRLFHLLVIVLIAVSYISIKLADLHNPHADPFWIHVHLASGFSMLALLLFRIAWGFIGSDTSRFRSFLVSPIAGLRHLRQFSAREPDTQVGHNAAGGWMVLIMLLLLALQVGTGLCANDNRSTEGPLAKYVGKSASDVLSRLHGWNFGSLAVAIALHIVAIVAYAVIKKQDLVRPMITGKKRLPAATRAPRMASPLAALAILAIAGAAVWVLATQI
jgi:cytochrome b